MVRNGLQWKDAPRAYGPHKTLYNRLVRPSWLGVFANIFVALAAEPGEPDRLMIDATHLNPKFSIVVVNGFWPSSVDRLPPPAPPLRQ